MNISQNATTTKVMCVCITCEYYKNTEQNKWSFLPVFTEKKVDFLFFSSSSPYTAYLLSTHIPEHPHQFLCFIIGLRTICAWLKTSNLKSCFVRGKKYFILCETRKVKYIFIRIWSCVHTKVKNFRKLSQPHTT